MLYNGERIGDGSPPPVDIAVDPLEGTTLTAKGQPNALCVVALSERGTMFDPGPVRLHGEDGRRLRHRRPALARPTRSRTCSTASPSAGGVQRRRPDGRDARPPAPRRADRAHPRRTAARIRLIPDGDVAGSLMAVWPDTGVDLLWGVGGTPEGVLVGGGDQGHRRRAARAGCGRATTTSARASSPPASIPTACSTTDDLVAGRQLLLRRDRRDRRRHPQGRAVHLARRRSRRRS